MLNELEKMKDKYRKGYVVVLNTDGTNLGYVKVQRLSLVTNENLPHLTAIHIKDMDILDAYLLDNNIDIYQLDGAMLVDFIEEYDEDMDYTVGISVNCTEVKNSKYIDRVKFYDKANKDGMISLEEVDSILNDYEASGFIDTFTKENKEVLNALRKRGD